MLYFPVCPPHTSSLLSTLNSALQHTSSSWLGILPSSPPAPTLLHLEHRCLLPSTITRQTTSPGLQLPQWNPRPRHYPPPPDGCYLSNSRPHTPLVLHQAHNQYLLSQSSKTHITRCSHKCSDQPPLGFTQLHGHFEHVHHTLLMWPRVLISLDSTPLPTPLKRCHLLH